MRLFDRAEMRSAIRGLLGPSAIRLMEGMVGRRSWAGTQALGRRLGRFGYRVDRRHGEVAARNIRFAFGEEMSEEQVQETVCGCFQHLAMFFLEALRMTTMSHEALAEVTEFVGEEHLHAALEGGKGAVVFSGHFGNWEIGAVRIIYQGLPLIPLSRSSRNPRLARAISGIRERLDFPVIPISEGAKGILRALKNNQLVPIMADRFARGQGLTVPFFGHPTHVWHTPALMAQRAGCPIIPCHGIRQADGIFRIEIDPPIHLPQTGDRDLDVWLTTAQTMAILESKLRRYPEQFTWPYELWRPEITPPPPYPLETFDPGAFC